MAVISTAQGEEVTTVDSSGQVLRRRQRVQAAPVPDEPPQQAYHTKKAIFRAYQVIWYVVGVIEVLLGFRFVLRLTGANSTSGFGRFIYGFSEPFVGPFKGLFPTPVVEGQFVFEWITLIAMLVYVIVAWGLVYLFQIMKPTNPEEVETHVDNP